MAKISVFIFLLSCLCREISSHFELTQLLMISFDGFRWDYINRARDNNRNIPNFERLIAEGVTITDGGMKTAFVTKTFPNHYTLVTGLYEENHGIVANYFYDPVFNEDFDMGSKAKSTLKWWNGTKERPVEPIWVTNQNLGGDESERKSGVVFWPGSEIDGQYPTKWLPYNVSMSFKSRVDKIVEWLTVHEDPINLGLMYIQEPDATGHHYGASSSQILDKVEELDGVIGYLIEKLGDHFDKLNMIIAR